MASTLIPFSLDDDEYEPPSRHPGGSGDPSPYPDELDEPTAEDYAAYSRARWDEQEEPMEALHRTWIQNLLFLAGKQWWEVNPITGMWGPMEVPEWREQPVSNLCISFFKQYLSKLTKVRPAWQAIAASSDPDDTNSAELAEDVLEAKWMELRLARTLRRALAWVIATGNCFVLPYWNTRTGKLRPLTIPLTVPVFDEYGVQIDEEEVECPCDQSGEPILTLDPETGEEVPDLDAEPAYVDVGEVGARIFSPFAVRVNAEAESDEEVDEVWIGEVVTIRDGKKRWPGRFDDVQAEDVGALEEYDRMVNGLFAGPDTQVVGGHNSRIEAQPKALVLHYYRKPEPEYPRGRYWCSVGRKTLLEDPQDLPEGFWPLLTHLKDIEVPGRFHGMATLEAVVGLNAEYNRKNGKIAEHDNLMVNGKWIVDKGSGVKPGSITNAPAEVIEKNPGFNVEQADLKPLPAKVYEERERILRDFERISGINRISMGEAPPGVTSGVAFLTLQEADDSDLGPTLAMLEESVAELAGNILRIIQARYDEERLIYVSGKNRRYQVKSFRGADLSGVLDVVPVTESSFPWSKTARQSMIIELAQKLPPLFQDDETGGFDKAKLARLLPIGGLEALQESEDIDLAEAGREEEAFEGFGVASLETPQVMPWQNHDVHYRQHVRLLKSAKFREWDPAAQQLFLQHVAETDLARIRARMAGMPLTPGENPGAPPPEAGGAPGGGPPAPEGNR